ncbi:hypothetical protein ABAC460_11510 [Asticcacaulis sp. AC460]|uniref:hypothetical protein n=1 Tax=Asticcacaulis sp. AC460 TaxID=1282360 RepID=UPI0003C3F17F|nr:hypothetical protein [Asticcacaulis sp. AC460]ESQ89919.1 hypothetical protein ABAC460_11510 [Asticcacaulis sp. AC460]
MKLFALSTLALTGLLTAGAVSAEEPETYAFQLEVGNGRCSVDYPRADGTTLTFLYLKSGRVNVSVHRPRWEMVDDKDTDNQDIPMTVEVQGVGKSKAKWGGYRNGFVQGVWSAWDENPSGAGSSGDLIKLMEQGTVYTIWFEGQNLGTFNTKMKGFAINSIRNCVNNPA